MLLALIACGKKGPPMPRDLPVPGGISDLRTDVKDGVIFISFTVPKTNKDGSPVKDLDGFRIQRSCGSCPGGLEPFKDIHFSDKEGYTIRNGRLYTFDNEPQSGITYGYRAFSLLKNGVVGEGSNIVPVTWKGTPPPPKKVMADEKDSTVVLSWEKEKGLSYNVYRYDGDTYPIFPLNGAPLADPQFRETGLENGKQYNYEIRSVMMDGAVPYEGRGTPIVATPRDTTPPNPPQDLVLVKKGAGVLLTWRASPELDFGGYNVYRIAQGKTERINRIPIQEPSFVDANPGPGLKYVSYYVTSVDKSGNEGGKSREQVIILRD
jgi:hypothetical protein